ncbi:MAG: 3'-5' exonuclease [Deltaproteobacteria bacterium]
MAVDFETADPGRDSACSIGLVRVEAGQIARREQRLIRPPRREFTFTAIHGLSWEDVAEAPPFREVWLELRPVIEGAAFLAAHNAGFDRSVLETCCAVAGLPAPRIPFRCTMQLARKVWALYPTRLPNVCEHLGIPLRHHEALSDAEACAGILLAAINEGHQLIPARSRELKPVRATSPRQRSDGARS